MWFSASLRQEGEAGLQVKKVQLSQRKRRSLVAFAWGKQPYLRQNPRETSPKVQGHARQQPPLCLCTENQFSVIP